jgi:D-tyrosyl-tRNA(Tyr) deacylase
VDWAEVEVGGEIVGRIESGLLVYVAAAADDGPRQIQWLAEKIAGLRILEDEHGKMNLNVQDVWGGVLVVSNFTLLADAQKGRRPSFDGAAAAELAKPLTDALVDTLRSLGCRVATGQFRATMSVRSQAAGPVNVIIDTADRSTAP